MGGDAALNAFIARLGKLRELAVETARAAAPRIERLAKEDAAAGQDPDGRPWKPKKDGSRPLEHAASALSVRTVGSRVDLVLRGVEWFHNKGTKHLPQRRILPDGGAGLPPRIAAELRAAAAEVFRRTMGGGR